MENRIGLKPLTNLSLVDKVEIRITDYIKTNKLEVGDPIPKEMEFAEALGVSRTVVREALTRLRTIGIIESKKHKGMILSQPDFIENFEKIMETNLVGDDTLKDIFELRLIMEMGMIDLVFARKTEKDLEELSNIVDKMENGKPESKIFSLKNEVAFHGKLYEMSGNKTLHRLQNILLPIFRYVHDQKMADAETYMYAKRFVTHRELLNFLKEDNKEKFRKGMARHLAPHFDRVLKNSEF